jgi:hypothetical protein
MKKNIYTDLTVSEMFKSIDGYKFHKMIEKNNVKFIRVEHELCGKIYDSRVDKFLGKSPQRCTCLRKRSDALIKDTNDYNKKINKEYRAISEYKGRKSPIFIQHNCGFKYQIKRAEFLLERDSNAGKCPVCVQQTHNTTEIINEKMKRQGYNTILAEEYKGANKKHLIKNNSCGHTYESFIDPVLNNLKGKRLSCPVCEKHSKHIDIERVQKEISEKAPTLKLISTDYTGTHNHLQVKCKKCDNTYPVSRTNILSGKGCPFCAGLDSKLEIELKEFVKKHYSKKIIFNKKFKNNEKKVYELDIYIPDLKLGIEFNGLYWHSDTFKDKNYHINKTLFFKDLGIRVIQIFEDEWLSNRNIVELKLSAIMGVSQQDRIYARNITIQEISSSEKNNFLSKNHIQGSDRSVISIGGFYNGDLVSVMTFSKLRVPLGSRKSLDGQYELSRFASSANVVGGFSRILKYAINNYEISSIKTFADLRWSSFDDNLYQKNGFKLSHISDPNYFYVPSSSKKRYHRFNFRKQVLKEKFPEVYDDNLSETEIMDKTNYMRVWDCGNMVYEMKIKE